MNKKMIIIFVIFVAAICITLFITNNYNSGLNGSIRSIERNTAKEILLHSGNTYTVGEEITPGYYDMVYAESGNNEKITYQSISLSKGDKMLNMPFEKGDEFTLFVEDSNKDGMGKIKLIPSSFSLLEQNEYGILLQHSGYYVVGEQLDAGKYDAILTLKESVEDSNKEIFIQVYSNLSLKKVVESYSFSYGDPTVIDIHEGEVLYFSNLIEGTDYEPEDNVSYTHSFESNDTYVRLIKTK